MILAVDGLYTHFKAGYVRFFVVRLDRLAKKCVRVAL